MILPKLKEITNILSFAKKYFSKGGFRSVTNYISGLISLSKKNITKISKAAKTKRSTLSYALSEANFDQEKLEKRYLKKAKYHFKNTDVYLLIDDTLNEKNGKHIEKTQYHHDHNTNKHIKGHQYFTAILYTPFLQLPIFPELYCPESISKIEMAKQLLDKLSDAGIKIHTVLFDSWYSDKTIINKCRRLKSRVVCAVKSNRNVFIEKSNRAQKISFISDKLFGQKVENYFIDDKHYGVWEREARLNKIPSIKFVISREIVDGKVKGTANLISTNQEDSAVEVIKVYKIRWKIETFHRDIKQNLGFGKAFIRRGNGIVGHSVFVILAYAVLNLFMFRSGLQMTIGECCEYLTVKSSVGMMKEIVEIEDRQTRLNEFEEVFIS